jgi:hypothetical protein
MSHFYLAQGDASPRQQTQPQQCLNFARRIWPLFGLERSEPEQRNQNNAVTSTTAVKLDSGAMAPPQYFVIM